MNTNTEMSPFELTQNTALGRMIHSFAKETYTNMVDYLIKTDLYYLNIGPIIKEAIDVYHTKLHEFGNGIQARDYAYELAISSVKELFKKVSISIMNTHVSS
ncbi:putative nucleic-acid-binding protein [Mesoflavibacter sabulilitoris]|uniref:Uncharacterized protein n=1 Tax=Mesoflavibacter zeaxanthinifaciens subsp. sabulilitoris TaxID=1520893 RepID=A0A2T1NNM8_9FLAO|nr:hypothetical protein [Mesoflavibacter zeaxanthinifaciens]MBB3125262.1 putative nucleic-acid-binding protein [Mesoflavibacter zeaxanthinifaciens subsp. sabulilitoris]PSG94497.1 hypothetical protein C7H61_00760 [Mesoflavibacter zeaxanthinifaciens subsp. sabulilitoris]